MLHLVRLKQMDGNINISFAIYCAESMREETVPKSAGPFSCSTHQPPTGQTDADLGGMRPS